MAARGPASGGGVSSVWSMRGLAAAIPPYRRYCLVRQLNSAMTAPAKPFWETKSLAEMTRQEWESLCDGCGKCCLIKLEYEDTGEIEYTDVACHQLDCATGRCKDYRRRQELVPDCVVLTPDNLAELPFMPPSCAYRRL